MACHILPTLSKQFAQLVPRCSKMFQDVPRCSKMFQDVPRIPRSWRLKIIRRLLGSSWSVKSSGHGSFRCQAIAGINEGSQSGKWVFLASSWLAQ